MQLKDYPEFRKLIGQLIPEPQDDEPSYKLIKDPKKAAPKPKPKPVCIKCRTWVLEGSCECGANLTEL